MSKYNTVQREALVRFLKEHKSSAFTISEIYKQMKLDTSISKLPGESTVYRLMKELVSSGAVKRTIKGSGRQFVYQITDDENCGQHLHMKCLECGRLYHMGDAESRKITEQILGNDSFALDCSTVLLGKCGSCK